CAREKYSYGSYGLDSW
nr:immunoglobulin heavy chain junction region [Macaca mulatta]